MLDVDGNLWDISNLTSPGGTQKATAEGAGWASSAEFEGGAPRLPPPPLFQRRRTLRDDFPEHLQHLRHLRPEDEALPSYPTMADMPESLNVEHIFDKLRKRRGLPKKKAPPPAKGNLLPPPTSHQYRRRRDPFHAEQQHQHHQRHSSSLSLDVNHPGAPEVMGLDRRDRGFEYGCSGTLSNSDLHYGGHSTNIDMHHRQRQPPQPLLSPQRRDERLPFRGGSEGQCHHDQSNSYNDFYPQQQDSTRFSLGQRQQQISPVPRDNDDRHRRHYDHDDHHHQKLPHHATGWGNDGHAFHHDLGRRHNSYNNSGRQHDRGYGRQYYGNEEDDDDRGCLDYPMDMTTNRYHNNNNHYYHREDEEEDNLVEVAPGTFVQLRGSMETWRAIQEGRTTRATCFVCSLSLVCIQNADMVMCPICRDISPVDQSPSSGGGLGLGMTEEEAQTVLSR